MLDLSRIEASKLTLRATSFDLRALVHEAVDLMATTARGKPVALSCTISWRLPARVEGDPMRLRQVLVNLLHNAVKFTERGRIVLDVTVLGESEDAVQLRFEVRDTGIGIAEDQFDSVFDAFTQVDSSSTGATAAAASAGDRQGARRAHGAGRRRQPRRPRLDLLARAGLKRAASRRRVASRARPRCRSARAHPACRRRPVNQMVLAAMLGSSAAGRCRHDGRAACDAAANGRYDLIFMDCSMPVMDGFEAARRIRDGEHRAGAGARRSSP